jgi:hypothetical protein
MLGRTGVFWQEECFDGLVRNEREAERIRGYIANNPVRAGLSATPESHPWFGRASLKQD